MAYSPLTEQLMEALQVLPGVGSRSAERMTLHLLERDREGGQMLSQALQRALDGVMHCAQCRVLTEQAVCDLCQSDDRDHSRLCVVETPQDREAIEVSGGYLGDYFVLQGHLSPIDGIGPDELGVPLLLERVKSGVIEEVILATNASMEGEATAHYLTEQLQPLKVVVSRIARGIPVGSEFGRIDSHSLSQALQDRKPLGFEHD
ncbi:recombination mediator RecR [Saccharospirillum alexandrii]|uniref:recombination mediator RecR n=1 Tax=Saccharospirillum alexandrii TaxID=2448477 RepID=UPI000FD7CF8F|nr:recombination mediator RecR [Saccharospirillum alexandrii]